MIQWMLALSLLFFLSACAHKSGKKYSSVSGSRGEFSVLLSEQIEKTCLNAAARERILALADPEKFPGTRYRKGPRQPASIEKETDCSHFVHQIYLRAGFPYHYRSSHDLKNASEFVKISESDALPGDLMVFRNHVGIVDGEGLIISATRKRRTQKSSITRMDRSSFPGFRGRRYALRYLCDTPQSPSSSEF